MEEPLSRDWIKEFFRRAGESASEIDLLLLEQVGDCLETLWEKGAVHTEPFEDFKREVLPLLDRIETETDSAPPTRRQRAILEALNFLRSYDYRRLHPSKPPGG